MVENNWILVTSGGDLEQRLTWMIERELLDIVMLQKKNKSIKNDNIKIRN